MKNNKKTKKKKLSMICNVVPIIITVTVQVTIVVEQGLNATTTTLNPTTTILSLFM